MTRSELIRLIRQRKSFLCIGLDTDLDKIPAGISVADFNKKIIDATRDLCVAYKPNLAFYECLGPAGWEILDETVQYIGKEHFTIADAKRGDIGNTSGYYAKSFFHRFGFDAVTVSPYMGRDSVEPFLQHESKWAIILALTSNTGAADFELLSADGEHLFEKVLRTSSRWGSVENTMYVVGATRAEMLGRVRKIVPNHFLLVPGVGAQGGSLQEVAKYGMTNECGLLVNVSRSILYASQGKDFAEAARTEAKKIQLEMEVLLEKNLML